ncbi:cation diffusion facilitator family transporter [Hydrogenobacter thermophilus TK-6]|uniref:Cation efflux system protein n=1 Tax=Hydrogenobacter thermophilus (strain DSM 6534 / IAM 12695 / TK-6) TaxID=608538 RepID=D3DJM9_HYDTT|nr:cation diffusion facilitator family transporter [Hydrogenobacter thermophilus]ADO45954.1 cation diffusion facilitator family transporter [Hydrogenobacter thermophilus TK-6]BAI70031.1 cation efflux system protein [Hydrogenobacter thermophilus TK-6]
MEKPFCKHQHVFYTPKRKTEGRMLLVFFLTLVFMIVEVVAGYSFGSVALLADGIHMGTHAVAFGIAFSAYVLARRWSRDKSFSFGTWKVEVLGAYTSAVVLGVMAFLVLQEALLKLIKREEIRYEEALFVAFAGLVVNLISAVILSEGDHQHHDLNLSAAYFHVLADALTSFLAIGALLGGKYLSMWYLDPLSGMVGFFVIISWSYSLIKDTSKILLDREMTSPIVQELIKRIESDGASRVHDIHLLRVHHDKYACILGITTSKERSVEDYIKRIEEVDNIIHTTVEIIYCPEEELTHQQNC